LKGREKLEGDPGIVAGTSDPLSEKCNAILAGFLGPGKCSFVTGRGIQHLCGTLLYLWQIQMNHT
jgi:hypothetical protein